MASHHTPPNSNSRLAQMQTALFNAISYAQLQYQHKQSMEREQKREELLRRTTPAVADSVSPILMDQVDLPKQNGKVRQMFDERRRGAGIDRGRLLKPITTSTISSKKSINNSSTVGSKTQGIPPRRKPISTSTTNVNLSLKNGKGGDSFGPVVKQRLTPNATNSSSTALSMAGLTKNLSSLSLGDIHDSNSNSRTNSNGSSRLRPIVVKKTPPPVVATSPKRSTAVQRQLGGQIKSPTQTNKPSSKSSARKISMSTKPAMEEGNPPEGMSKCQFCGRTFNNDRLGKHENVCQKMMVTKRKIFDASKQRIKGTDSEKYTRKQGSTLSRKYSSAAQVYGLSSGIKKNNWRKKHEDFIKSIRAAKQVQAHLKSGGNLKDLPPPPPSENLDYIQCPHCLRRFNQQAAERHIPRCATMLHNKPKPGAQAKPQRH